MKNKSAQDIIEALGLQPLPDEGGYYKETYRSPETTTTTFGTNTKPVIRNLSTQILYMVTEDSFSALHRLKQDEVYHFYDGLPAEILLIFPDRTSKIVVLGRDVSRGESLQLLIPAGTWQGVRLKGEDKGFSLMGTTVAPGFDFADFELGNRVNLIAELPELEKYILKYTRASK